MATLPELENALRKAHAAGNTEHARAFAAEIRRMRGAASTAAPAKSFEQKVAEERAATPDAASNMSTLDRLRAGFGKAFADTGEGIKQFGIDKGREFVQRAQGINDAVGFIPAVGEFYDAADRYMAGKQADQQARITQSRELDAPLMRTGAGQVGNITGQVAQAVVIPGGAAVRGATLAPKLAVAAGQGAVFAGSQPVADGESRGENVALGAGLGTVGQGVASGLGRIANGAKARMPEAVQTSIDLARRAGIPLNVSQVTDSLPIKAAAAASKWLPFSGAGKAARNQQEAFNAAVGRSFGVDGATALTDDVMKGARRKIGDVFEDVYSRNDVPLAPADLRKLVALETNAAKNLTNEEAQVLRNQLDRILDNTDNGVLTGKKYQAVRTALQGAEGPDKIGSAVKALRKELDDIAAKAVGPDDAARLAKSRGQWANLRTAEDALKQVGGAAGNIRPASLWPLIRNGSTKEMRELAKIGQNVLKEGLGDSGTAQRQFYTNLLTGTGGALGAAQLGMLGLVAKGAAGGALIGRGLNSNTASKLLQQGRPTGALAKLAQGTLPRSLPLAAPSAAAAKGKDEKRKP